MESLERVWESYQLTVDSIKVSRRAVESEPAPNPLLFGTNFWGALTTKTAHQLDTARNDVSDLFILALWSVFERKLRDHMESEGPRPLEASAFPFHHRLATKVQTEMEYWRNDDVLDLFKSIVAPELIGRAKQIKQYRDWVAHRDPKRPRPPSITPRTAYSTLAEIFESLAAARSDTAKHSPATDLPLP